MYAREIELEFAFVFTVYLMLYYFSSLNTDEHVFVFAAECFKHHLETLVREIIKTLKP